MSKKMADDHAIEFPRKRFVKLVNEFLAASPPLKQHLLERERNVLFHPAVEAYLRDAAKAAERNKQQERAEIFTVHADLLANRHADGIENSRTIPDEVTGDIRACEYAFLLLEAAPDQAGLERQITVCRKILALCPNGIVKGLLGTVQYFKATALRDLGILMGDAGLLRQAESAYRAALLEHTRKDSPLMRATILDGTGTALRCLGELTGDTKILARAETAFRESLLERSRERAPMLWADTQDHLGLALARRGSLSKDEGALQQAISAFEASLLERTRSAAPLKWAATQSNLGLALHSLGVLTSDARVLEQAVDAFNTALLELTPENHPADWATTQNNLGSALGSLGDLYGAPAMLRRAEATYLAALHVQSRERTPTEWARTQANLAEVLSSLGALTSDVDALRRAELALHAVLLVRTQEGTAWLWAQTQQRLGCVLSNLAELTHDIEALARARAAFSEALLEFQRDPEKFGDWIDSIGIFILRSLDYDDREISARIDTVERFEKLLRAGLTTDLRKRAPVIWARRQNTMGALLRELGDMTGDLATLKRAEAAFRVASQVHNIDHGARYWAGILDNLGFVLYRIGKLTKNKAVLEEAEATLRIALGVRRETGELSAQQLTAGELADLLIASGRFGDAAAVIAPALARSELSLSDATRNHGERAGAVRRISGLFSLLSLCLLRQEQPDVCAALIAAESGRARRLADTLLLDTIRVESITDPEIRASIEAARSRLVALRYRLGHGPSTTKRHLSPAEREPLEKALRQATDAYESLRRTHGLLRTLEPLSLDQIFAAAPTGGALVLLVLPMLIKTPAFAFIVVPDAESVSVVELPHLDGPALAGHLNGKAGWAGVYGETFRTPDDEGDDGVEQQQAAEARWHAQLTATLTWLWERLLAPLHGHLRNAAKLAPCAPVVLIAPGQLGLLPLQAAGPGPDGMSFADHWTVSFAPSIRTLLTCRQRLDACRGLPAKLLAVIDPPSEAPLSGARLETPMLRRRFAHAEQVILEGATATLAAVLEHLPSATYFHASTHGSHDWRDPTQSELHLADTELRLEMLRDTRLEAARLVFLCACESGLADVRQLPDEFIGLTAGFVQAGAACVVGSLWPIRDDAAFLLASRFYDLHLDEHGREGKAPAAALRETQDWLRHLTFGDLRRMFTVIDGPDGSFVLLQGTLNFIPGAAVVPLPLGPNDARPYAAPDHWAAFIVTGR